MAAGEYVSVYSQADTEKTALVEEDAEIKAIFHRAHRELADLCMRRGLDFLQAHQVAAKLMAQNVYAAHACNELGITLMAVVARPLQAALASTCSFATGAAMPLAGAVLAPEKEVTFLVATAVLASLAFLGGLAAKTDSVKVLPGVLRVTLWSTLAKGVSAEVGALFGVAV